MTAYDEFLGDLMKDVDKLENTPNEYPRKTPISITSDDGFNFHQFKEVNDKLHIQINTQTARDDHISGGNRLGIIDRLTRTIKNILMKYAFSTKHMKPVGNIMKDIMDSYNDTENRGLSGQTPNEVFESKELRYQMFQEGQIHNNNIDKTIDFQIGDRCRVYEDKDFMGKEQPRFSKEIYTIVELKGYKFKVKGEKGELKRLFKSNELQKVIPDAVRSRAEDLAPVLRKEKKKQRVEATNQREGIDQENVQRGVRGTRGVWFKHMLE
jgi:hypothetical protein